MQRVPSFVGEVLRFAQDNRQVSAVVIRAVTHKIHLVFVVIPNGVEESLDVKY